MNDNSAILNARPRRVSWSALEVESDDQFRLTNTRSQLSIIINCSSKAIWELCDGLQSVSQIMDFFARAYPDYSSIEDEVLASVQQLVNARLLLLDGGDQALEYRGDVVQTLTPTDLLIERLEQIRTFFFKELKIEEAADLQTDLESLLGIEALERAMHIDADAARRTHDSKVVSYGKAREIPLVADNIATIIEQIRLQIPDVSSDLEVSGNAIYFRGSHMGWHSNHSRSDGRVYCSWAEKGNSNFFRYQDPLTGDIVTQYEEPGWNIKSFTIPPQPFRFWHCIGAASLRLSLGFRYSLPEQKQ